MPDLRALHRPGDPLVLANAWDVASARLVVELGFPAVATSSGAVARCLGYEDGEHMPADVAFAAVARMAAAVSVPLTADVEAGYGLPPGEVAERLSSAGAAGCNYEDTDHAGGGLVDAESQAERVAVLARAGLVVNARVDVREPDVEEIVRRGRLYLDAGATCVYPIFQADEAVLGAVVDRLAAPVNALLRPGSPSPARLRALGVARISVGSAMFRAALDGARAFAASLR